MNKSIITALSLVTLLSIPAASSAESRDGRQKQVAENYIEGIKFENRDIAKNGREVCLSMDVVLDSARIKTQHTVSLTPVLVSSDGKTMLPFETIIVDGRTRHKVSLRKDQLDSPDQKRDSAQAVIMRRNGRDQEYAYVSVLPYSRWMLDGKIVIHEEVTGCAECDEGETEAILDSPVLPTFIPQWKVSGIEPEPEPVKYRAESRIARLQFALDKYDIRPGLAGNQAVLDTVTNSIDLVKDKEYISITGIYVAGYASPEGTYEYNMKLSGNRAASFARYIAEHNGVDPDIVSVEWSGEDWDGFRDQLEKSSFEKKDTVLSIIDTYTSDRNLCEKVMRDAISRGEYQWLVENVYPYLRHCMYRVEYEVRNFNLEEARQIINERPQDLGLKEIYAVAASYGKGTEEYEHAMSVARRFYPDSPSVLADRALEALEDEDPVGAIAVLRDVPAPAAPELLNILGLAYVEVGQYDKARELFIEASAKGNEDAAHNLTQLDGVSDQL